jgi:hydroxyacylglutathione hydrolase
MWASLLSLRALPDATTVFFGHDYSLSNGRFALGVDGGNGWLVAAVAEAQADADAGRFRSFTTIGREKALNPFLRADTSEIAGALGMAGRPAVEVFAELRERKNRF